MTDNKGVEWNGVTEKMARQILVQGELFLQTQVTLAVAADQRASTAASILASAATAIAAAFIAFWDKTADKAALIGGLTGAAMLMIAAGMAAYAARPTDFQSPGNHPNKWFGGRRADLPGMIGGEAESVQRRIDKNDLILVENQRWVRRAFQAALTAPFAAVLVWLIASSSFEWAAGRLACFAA